jgi:hypothetical protein
MESMNISIGPEAPLYNDETLHDAIAHLLVPTERGLSDTKPGDIIQGEILSKNNQAIQEQQIIPDYQIARPDKNRMLGHTVTLTLSMVNPIDKETIRSSVMEGGIHRALCTGPNRVQRYVAIYSTRRNMMYIVMKLQKTRYARKEFRNHPKPNTYYTADLSEKLHARLSLPTNGLYKINTQLLERLAAPNSFCRKIDPNCAYAQGVSWRITQMLQDNIDTEYSLTGSEITAAVYNTALPPYGQDLFVQMVGQLYLEHLMKRWPEDKVEQRAQTEDFIRSMIAAISNREISVFQEAVDQGKQYFTSRFLHEMSTYPIDKKYRSLPDKVATLC